MSDAGEWYATDALGSVRLTLDNNGTAFSGATYDPWGSPERGSVGTFGFTGELQQGDNVYLRARWYNANNGTFTSKDPFEGNPQQPYSLHPYQYAYSNPVLWTDPTGKCVPEWVPFVGEDGCTLSAGIGQGQLDVDGFQEYSADVVQGMGILGAVVVDAVAGTNGTQQILDDAGPGTYLGMAVAGLALGGSAVRSGGAVVRSGGAVVRSAGELATNTYVRGQTALATRPLLARRLLTAGVAANFADDAALAYTALTGDAQAQAAAYTAYQIGAADGHLPFADVFAAGKILFSGRNRCWSEKFSLTGDEFDSFASYWAQRNPQAQIDAFIEKYDLSKHLKGKNVVYAGERSGVSGGVHPLDPNTIKIYQEGIAFGDRYFVETLIEEIHHSKLMGIAPHTRLAQLNKLWEEIVEPRAKAYAARYADRLGLNP
jgi:RHS repeat-associated protein